MDPSQINVKNQETGQSEWVWSERSYPWKWEANSATVGIMIDAEGPSHFQNVRFLDFKSNDVRRAAAIQWHDGYR